MILSNLSYFLSHSRSRKWGWNCSWLPWLTNAINTCCYQEKGSMYVEGKVWSFYWETEVRITLRCLLIVRFFCGFRLFRFLGLSSRVAMIFILIRKGLLISWGWVRIRNLTVCSFMQSLNLLLWLFSAHLPVYSSYTAWLLGWNFPLTLLTFSTVHHQKHE